MPHRFGFRMVSTILVAFIAALPIHAGKVRQMTDSKDVSFDWPMPIGDGSEIIIASSTNQYSGGGNPQHAFQIAAIDPVTGTATQITSFTASLTHLRHNVSVTDDGQWLAFISNGDLIPGQNGDRSDEAFAIKRDGTSFVQLTHTPGNAGNVSRISMSGASNRVAFVSSANLTGGNPQRAGQLYVIDRDGTNLIQLTNAPTGGIDHMWISDNGTRLAFNHTGDLTGGNADKNNEVFTIQVGDALPRQITSSTGTKEADSANISGDGNTIVFESTANYTGGNADGGDEIFKADWTTGAITQLTTIPTATRTSRQPWPTNDGTQIYFSSNRLNAGAFEIWKVASNGTGLTRLTDLNLDCEHPVVSGDGSRFGTWLDGGLYTGTTFATEVPIIVRNIPGQGYAEISGNGQKIIYTSSADPLGLNPDHVKQIFTSNVDGSALHQLSLAVPPDQIALRGTIVGDGSRVYFESSADPLGLNSDHNNEIFGANPDGTGLIQLTSCSTAPAAIFFSGYTGVSADGSTIVFVSLCNLTGGNATGGQTGVLFKVKPDGTGLTQLTSITPSFGTTYHYYPRLDTTGTWVTFGGNVSNTVPGGGFPQLQVFRAKTDGTSFEQITTDVNYWSQRPDISGDGTTIVFQSASNITAQNADHNFEIFLYRPGTATPMRQLTNTTKGNNVLPRITRDGHYVFFVSSSELLENDPDHAFGSIYRYDLTNDTVVRSGGLRFENLSSAIDGLTEWVPSVNADGSALAYSTFSDSVGKNPDEYWEVITADYNAQNPPIVSPHAAPTTITFEPEPGLISYDVIRGSLASLHFSGGTVDLGAVTCVEDNSGDTTTAGNPDIDTPSPGQGFFYVFRGAMAVVTGPGSYGTSKTGSERVSGAGGCLP